VAVAVDGDRQDGAADELLRDVSKAVIIGQRGEEGGGGAHHPCILARRRWRPFGDLGVEAALPAGAHPRSGRHNSRGTRTAGCWPNKRRGCRSVALGTGAEAIVEARGQRLGLVRGKELGEGEKPERVEVIALLGAEAHRRGGRH
jgi:hypothetical protein